MKRLALTLVICLGCMSILGAQNVWKPISSNSPILGAASNGDLYAMGGYSGLLRSQDEGETWQVVLGYETGFSGYINQHCFAVSNEGRICVFNDNQQTVVYSDDNGDTWQQTPSISSCAMPDKAGLCVPTNDIMVVWAENGEISYTLDGGVTWDGWILDFLENSESVSDLLVNENGDVYVSVDYYIMNIVGIYHSTLSGIQNWELVAFEGISIKDMAFDPEGNVVACGYNADGSSVGFQHIPGFYLFDGTSLAISDEGVVYTPHFMGLQAVLSYSTDHGEHFTEIGEHLPLVDIAPGGENARLSKGADNHLYFDGGGEYWKSIQNADEIISDIPTNVVYNIWKPLNLPGILLGANAQGDLFCRNTDVYPSTLVRSQDDGETWETVFDGSVGSFTISNEGRIFVFNNNTVTVMYSDDNGDTWQQTNQISSCGLISVAGLYAATNDIVVGWTQNREIFWTLDGGETWGFSGLEFMEEHQEISDLLVSENGDVYVSVWYYIGPNIGVYHSTLSDMQNWEIAAFENVGVKDMAFDPEGNIVCGVNFGGDFSGFEHVPGFYALWANRVAIADNGIVYKTAMSMYNNAVLAYSLDHGEHFYNTIENLPVEEPIPGGEDGFLSKGHDNHLYFFGDDQYWKSIPNANDIPNVIAFPSEWYYEIENENGSITYQYLYQAGDTIVQDEPTHILVKINTLYDKGLREDVTREYVYMRDGKVYWWNKTLEEFTVLYDFSAEEGDTWVTKVGTETLIMHVDAVEEIEYEGKTYRMLRVSDVDDYFSGDIVCGIGHLTSFFPERLMDNGDGLRVEGLRCYWIEDELVFKPGDEDCDAIYSDIHGVEEESPSSGSGTFAVYPNPTNSVLTIHHSSFSIHHSAFRITNLMGQTVLSGNITTENQQINVSSLPQGMYFITFAGETRKFVVR